MDSHFLITLLLFFSSFLGLITLVQIFSNRTQFPYTVALLIVGFLAQGFVHATHLDLHLSLPPEIIYFVLLPILLFEAAMHINLHQFRLQFKTISFLATFGLLVAVFVVAGMLTLSIGMPFDVALLFGALISATDPIAVLALFKTLGAPRRLSLLADGESMFNDATAVIAFRIISGFVVTGHAFETTLLFHGLGDFLYVFFGSLALGSVLGLVGAYILSWIRDTRLLVSVMTASLALGSFVGSEHFFHLSGVITVVMAGIVMGNLGKTTMTPKVESFIEKLWEYFGFISLSLVFFFASYTIDTGIFFREPFELLMVILAVLISRAASVYVTFFLTNNLPLFNDEPNVPMSWQHILNWGGLRGVIPLVLAYSLPDSFIYKESLVAYTLVSLVFTIVINGLSIKSLLMKLGLHLPKKEEAIINQEERIFAVEEAKDALKELEEGEFSPKVISQYIDTLNKEEEIIKKDLLRMAGEDDLLLSLKIQAIEIERNGILELYHNGHINERVFYRFETELDVQQDALEYPEVFSGRAVEEGGYVDSSNTYRTKIKNLRRLISTFPILKSIFQESVEVAIEDRYALLRARLLTSNQVMNYLQKVSIVLSGKNHQKIIQVLKKKHLELIENNQAEIKQMEKKNEKIVVDYQRRVLSNVVQLHPSTGH